MNTRPQLVILAGAAGLALGACAIIGWGSGVSVTDKYIAIRPGTNISTEDQQKLDRILRHYNSAFYQIRQTAAGQVKAHGRLKDIFIEEKLVKNVASAGGVANWSVQIGTQAHPDHTVNPDHTHHPEHWNNPDHWTNPDHHAQPQRPHHPLYNADHTSHPDFSDKDMREMTELVRQVTPILKNYSHN